MKKLQVRRSLDEIGSFLIRKSLSTAGSAVRLMLAVLFVMNCAKIYSSQDIERHATSIEKIEGFNLYNAATENIKNKGIIADRKLTALHKRKKNITEEFSLEIDIEVIHPHTRYKQLIPLKSYATLNVSRYATHDEINHAHKNLQTKNPVQNLVIIEAMHNINDHQKIKNSYRSLTAILHGSCLKKGFIKSKNAMNMSDQNIQRKYKNLLQPDEINAARRKNLIEKFPATIKWANECKNDGILKDRYNYAIYFGIGAGLPVITMYLLRSMSNKNTPYNI